MKQDKKDKKLKAGVEPHTLPDEDGQESNWWGTANEKKKTNTLDSNEKKVTLTEEYESIKSAPVVGKLPWKTQYLVFGVLLVLSLLSLVYFSLMGPKQSNVSSGINSLNIQMQNALEGKGISQADYNNVLNMVESNLSSELPGDQVANFKQINLKTVPALGISAQNTVQIATRIRDALAKSINSSAPLWRQAGDSGQWTTVEAVNFAQVLSEVQYLQEVANRVSNGQGEIPERASTARQNIEQSIRIYASSPAAKLNTPLSQAWRTLAAGFAPLRADLDSLVGSRQQWNELVQAKNQLNKIEVPVTVKKESKLIPILISSLLMLGCSGAIWWIGWRQQRYQVIEAQLSNEGLKEGVDIMRESLKNLSRGDLTVKLPLEDAEEAFKPVYSIINSSVKDLRQMTNEVKKTASKTTSVAQKATDATSVLVDSIRNHIDYISTSGQEILDLSQGMKVMSKLSDDADELCRRTNDTINIGKDALEVSRNATVAIKTFTDQGALRAQRLEKSTSEVLLVSSFLANVADQIDVLAIQAGIQAAKAGEHGQSFKVVADGLKHLAEKSSESVSRVSSLVENNAADIRFMDELFHNVGKKAEEASQSSEVSSESLLMVAQAFEQIEEVVFDIKKRANDQEVNTDKLAQNARVTMEQMEEDSETAKIAADTAAQLLEESKLLDNSTRKFKTKE